MQLNHNHWQVKKQGKEEKKESHMVFTFDQVESLTKRHEFKSIFGQQFPPFLNDISSKANKKEKRSELQFNQTIFG